MVKNYVATIHASVTSTLSEFREIKGLEVYFSLRLQGDSLQQVFYWKRLPPTSNKVYKPFEIKLTFNSWDYTQLHQHLVQHTTSVKCRLEIILARWIFLLKVRSWTFDKRKKESSHFVARWKLYVWRNAYGTWRCWSSSNGCLETKALAL